MTYHETTADVTRHDGLREALQAALAPALRLEREIAGGGTSRLFVATQGFPTRRVVVKALSRGAGDEVVRRFRREVALTAALHHPRILPVLGAGETAQLLYYVTPFIEGGSLADRLRQAGRLPVAEAVRLLRELDEALAHAHAHGVVHGDVKPDNVLLQEGHALLADFGGARLHAERRATWGAARAGVVGTPLYMSPEQAAGDPTLDARSDVYSLAVVGYELLTGRPPFRGANPRAVLLAHLGQPVPSLRARRPDVPPALAAVLERALAKDPAHRFASAAAFLAALGGGATRARTTRRPPMGPPAPRPRAGSRPVWRVAAMAALAPAIATLGGLLASGGTLALLLSATPAAIAPSTPAVPSAATAAATPQRAVPPAAARSAADAPQHLAAIVVRPPWDAVPVAHVRATVRASTTCTASLPAPRRRAGARNSA
ncbi:MAG TPA: serine/threonine-protein kinase [Gemmatimonadaceae bacterium]|nr:serine/threonine-protein kinase [Gemmatimonadaceae bacterium]